MINWQDFLTGMMAGIIATTLGILITAVVMKRGSK